MRKQIQLRDKIIGEEAPIFVIAEIGVTCNYDLEMAKALIGTVRDRGADAVKFIFWFPDEIMSDRTVLYDYDTTDGKKTENMYDMLNSLRFTLDEWKELKGYADDCGVVMFSTVNSPSGITYAESVGLEAYKLSSWDYNYLPLWRRIASLGKPMLIDTGPVSTLEVAKVLQVMKDEGNDQCVLLHCFHTQSPHEMNMRAIPYMRRAFDCLVGFSAEGQEDQNDIMAVTLGAKVIEKRLTLDRELTGHNHILSKEPEEFKRYVAMIRDVDSALGRYELRPSPNDLAERKKWFRHLVAARDVAEGTVLTEEMLDGKRPENGISPEYMNHFIGRPIRRALRADEAISWDDV